MTDIERSYIAGIIDGEGCVTINHCHNSFRPTVQVGNTKVKLIKFLQKHLGGNISIIKRKKNHNILYRLNLKISDLENILCEIKPFLLLKNK